MPKLAAILYVRGDASASEAAVADRHCDAGGSAPADHRPGIQYVRVVAVPRVTQPVFMILVDALLS
jgi:hypothetical protein